MFAGKPTNSENRLPSPIEQTNKTSRFQGIRNLFTVLAIGAGAHFTGWYLELSQHLQTGLLVIISCMVIAAVSECGNGKAESITINVILGLLTQYACYYFELDQTIRAVNALNACFTIYLAVNKGSEDAENPKDERHDGEGQGVGLDGTSISGILIVAIFIVTVAINFFAGYFPANNNQAVRLMH